MEGVICTGGWIGTGVTQKNPKIMGKEVPTARSSSKEEVSPEKNRRAIAEKKKAESPNPDMTIPVVVALCYQKR